MRTISFPSVEAFTAGIASRRERSVYLDGLALLQEASTPRETFSPASTDFGSEVARMSRELPHLAPHLVESATRVRDAVNSQAWADDSNVDLALAVELHHLRNSMKDRFIDLAVELGRMKSEPSSRIQQQYSETALETGALWRDVSGMRECNFPEPAIKRTLGLRVIPRLHIESSQGRDAIRSLPGYPDHKVAVYKHTNSKGVTYYLNRGEVRLRGGHIEPIFFFTKVIDPVTASVLPANRVVKENPRNGFLTISKRSK